MQNFLIGLPAFNEENNINKLLDRIDNLKPLFGKRLFVLVVNDRSTDNTESILKEYVKNFNYITYINHSKNMGLGKAMNTILKYAVNNFDENDIVRLEDNYGRR